MNLAVLLASSEVATKGKAFHVPEAGELFHYPTLFTVPGTDLAITFPTVVMFVMTIVVGAFFLTAFRNPKLVPVGAQNVAETGVDFVRKQIVQPILGPEGAGWLPFLCAVFFWVWSLNFMGIIPGIQFPVTSRMAYPAMLAILAWLIYNAIGVKNQGFFGYLKNTLFPPGVPWWVYVLLTPIEFISNFVVRPLTLAVRLFANMVAGHMILSVLFISTAVFFSSGIGKVTFILPFMLATTLTGFEIFVGAIQAFIMTILIAVYIQSSMEAHH